MNSEPTAPAGLRQSFLFADLSGFTAMTEVHGDEEAADVAEGFADAVQLILPGYRAEEVKRIGDAVMLRTEEASRAVELALRVATEVGEQHGSPTVRVGINTGTAIERGGDWFGATVNVAARVAGAAAGGQVLLTKSTRDAAGQLDSIEFLPRGRRKLRNVSKPVQLYEAVAGGEATSNGLPVDPVCRMAVDPIHSVGSLRYRGVVFFFCSFECADAFARDPGRFGRAER